MNPCKGVLKPVGIESFAIHTKLSIAARNVMNFTKTSWQVMIIWILLLNYLHIRIPLMNSNKKVAFFMATF